MQRLKTRPQFQAAMAGGIVSRTPHFALHRLVLDTGGSSFKSAVQSQPSVSVGLDVSLPEQGPQALFNVHGVWLGAMVPKRWARRAVTRNTIKRQIYNVGDTFESQLARAAHVVRLRTAFDRKQFPSATSDPLKLAVRAELLQLFSYATRRKVVVAGTHLPAAPAVAQGTPQGAAQPSAESLTP